MNSHAPAASPILSIQRGDAEGVERRSTHSHPEPVLLGSSARP